MVELQQELESLHNAGLQVVGVSPDSVDVLATFAGSSDITFPLLADENSQVIESFGILAQRGLPHPGTILIDQEGTIQAKLFRDGYRERHLPRELVAAGEALE